AGFTWNGSNFAALAPRFNLIATADEITPSEFNIRVTQPAPAQGVVPIGNFASLWAWNAALSRWFFYAPSLEASGGLPAVKGYTVSHNYLHFQEYNKTL